MFGSLLPGTLSWDDKFQERIEDGLAHLNGILGNAGVSMNRTLYVVLWVFEALMIVGLVLAFALPIQNYALREYIQWQQHPSPETYKAYLETQRLERAMRFVIAAPCGVTAILLTRPLKRYRQKLRRTDPRV